MKRVIFTLALLISGVVLMHAQTDSIRTVERGGLLLKKKYYTKCDIELTDQQIVKLIAKDPNLKSFVVPVTIHYGVSAIMKSVGLTLIAWPVVDSFSKGTKPNWNLAYIGAGCLVVSIPFTLAYNKKVKQAFDYYNSGYKKTSAIDLNLNVNSNGLGLAMNF